MAHSPLKWGRLAIAAVAVLVFGALVAPVSAFAATKAATRIVVTKQVVANWATPGVSPIAPVVTAKLQKKSGSKWVSLKGSIKVYAYNPTTKVWVYQGARTVTALACTLTTRGNYKFLYSGSSSTKSTYSYSKRVDLIGESVSDATVTFTPVDATYTLVTVSYDVSWNTEAFWHPGDHPLELSCRGAFWDNAGDYYSGWMWHTIQIWEPGTYEFSYKVKNADIPAAPVAYEADAQILSEDAYVATSASSANPTDYTPLN